MKVAFKSLIAAAAFLVAAGASHATVVTVNTGSTVYKGHTVTGSEVLTLSDDATGMFAAIQTLIGGTGTAEVVVISDANGLPISVKSTAAVSALKVEDTNDQMNAILSTTGVSASTPVQNNISSGGSLTITDLDVDLANHVVFATVVGANGVGTLTHFPLWNIANVLGATNLDTVPNSTAVIQLQVSGLSLTTQAADTVAKSLGLLNLGKAALSSVTDYGTLAVTLTEVAAEQPRQGCAVNFNTTKLSSYSFNTQVTVTNMGSNASTGWTVNWLYGKDALLSNVKNAKITRKSLKSYSAQPLASNATLDPWGMTTFTFRGQTLGGIPAISGLTATLGGQACAVTAQ